MSDFRTTQGLMTWAPEATYGTAPASGYTALAIQADPTWSPMEGDYMESSQVAPYFTGTRTKPTRLHQTFTFQVELFTSGTAGTAPPWGGLMLPCHYSEGIVSSTSTTYSRANASAESATLRWAMPNGSATAGLVHQMTGCKGTWSLTANLDGNPVIEFAFTGLYSVMTDGSAPSAAFANHGTVFPISGTNTSTVTINSVARCMTAFELAANNQIEFQHRAGCSPRVTIIGSAPSGSVTVEQPTMATQDLNALVTGGGLHPIVIGHTPGAGNNITINVASASFGQPSYTNLNGTLGRTMPFTVYASSSTSPLSLVLT